LRIGEAKPDYNERYALFPSLSTNLTVLQAIQRTF